MADQSQSSVHCTDWWFSLASTRRPNGWCTHLTCCQSHVSSDISDICRVDQANLCWPTVVLAAFAIVHPGQALPASFTRFRLEDKARAWDEARKRHHEIRAQRQQGPVVQADRIQELGGLELGLSSSEVHGSSVHRCEIDGQEVLVLPPTPPKKGGGHLERSQEQEV